MTMKYIKTTICVFFLLSVISCTESETEKSIRDMIFNQNNIATGNNLPKSNILSFNTTNFNFGTVQNGSTNQLLLEIHNSHNAPVNVTLTHTNSITQITYSENSYQIPANGTYYITVTFTPTATMFLNDTLRFSYPANVSNSSGPITQTVNLNGNSVSTATLTVLPTGTIDFGNLPNGQTATRYIQLTNTGTTTANWTKVGNIFSSIVPSSGNLLGGASIQVALGFTATGVGLYTGTLTISYNGGTVQIPYRVNRI